MSEVEEAIQEMFQAPHIQVMRSCSKLSKVFLAAMVHELYKTRMSETTFEKLAQTVSCLCTSNGITFPGWDTLLRIGIASPVPESLVLHIGQLTRNVNENHLKEIFGNI